MASSIRMQTRNTPSQRWQIQSRRGVLRPEDYFTPNWRLEPDSLVGAVYRAMRAELESHIAKEENVLFPAVRKLEAAPETCHFAFGSVDNPIRMMRHEHEVVGNSLQSLRELTGDFTPPKDACPTFRVMFESLTRLEQDLHIHIHKENNILFPRAQELEQTVAAG